MGGGGGGLGSPPPLFISTHAAFSLRHVLCIFAWRPVLQGSPSRPPHPTHPQVWLVLTQEKVAGADDAVQRFHAREDQLRVDITRLCVEESRARAHWKGMEEEVGYNILYKEQRQRNRLLHQRDVRSAAEVRNPGASFVKRGAACSRPRPPPPLQTPQSLRTRLSPI